MIYTSYFSLMLVFLFSKIILHSVQSCLVINNYRKLYHIQDLIIWTDQKKRNGIHAGIRDTGQKVRGIIHPEIGTAYDVITYDSSLQPLVKGVDLHFGFNFPVLRTTLGHCVPIDIRLNFRWLTRISWL